MLCLTPKFKCVMLALTVRLHYISYIHKIVFCRLVCLMTAVVFKNDDFEENMCP